MKELNADLKSLNQNIDELTKFEQNSIEKLMDKFREVGGPNEI